jgi:hypothetical protein
VPAAFAGRVSPAASSSAITGIFCPTSAISWWTLPSCQLSTSTAALLVSTMATTWPFFTVSPTPTFHSSSVPSSMSAPNAGSLNSIMRKIL